MPLTNYSFSWFKRTEYKNDLTQCEANQGFGMPSVFSAEIIFSNSTNEKTLLDFKAYLYWLYFLFFLFLSVSHFYWVQEMCVSLAAGCLLVFYYQAWCHMNWHFESKSDFASLRWLWLHFFNDFSGSRLVWPCRAPTLTAITGLGQMCFQWSLLACLRRCIIELLSD